MPKRYGYNGRGGGGGWAPKNNFNANKGNNFYDGKIKRVKCDVTNWMAYS